MAKANAYVDELRTLLDRAQPRLSPEQSLEIKPFFGGAAGYVDGHICMSLTKVGFALKLPELTRTHLFRTKDALELRYFPNAPVKKQYVLLAEKRLDDPKQLQSWIEESIVFVTT